MGRTTFMLISLGIYLLTGIIILIILMLINKKEKKQIKKELEKLEKSKNLIISAGILSELNKVESLINNDEMKEKYKTWQNKLNEIKNKEIPKITDTLIKIDELFEKKEYKKLKEMVLKVDYDLNFLKTKADFLLSEIKEVTLSEEKNREIITKLKSEYREIINTYHENEANYAIVKVPIELQFENADKLFAAFESAMNQNAYTEVGKIVKAIEDIVNNLKVAIDETIPIVNLGKVLIPQKQKEITKIYEQMTKKGYNLEYLNIEYNINEANKKIADAFQRLNVLNFEDSLFELKTIHDYFDSLYSDFDNEKLSKRIYEDFTKSILLKTSRLEKINNELYKKLDDIKYSYDLSEKETNAIIKIKSEIIEIRESYDKIVDIGRNHKMAYSKLAKEMTILNEKLLKTEEKLNLALKTLSSLKEDELRAHDQLDEIKKILFQTKEKMYSYKLPVIPKNYYIELAEAMEAIDDMNNALGVKPIQMKILNTRVDTARDLVLKVYNTVNETIKTAKMAEAAIVYGNRYRAINHEVDFGLIKAENLFYKGNFKNSLENAISAINIAEPGIYKKLLKEYR